jgi:outer membrane protein assembly factor BamE
VSQEAVTQLRRGMTKEQVRFLLGTPLVTDIFHADRWDYVYRLDKPGQELRKRRLAVFFEGDRLVRVEGDVVAAAPGAEPAQ